MSRNEWENGEIKLPTAEFAKMRKLLEDGDRRRKEELFDLTQVFWKGLTANQKSDPAAYRKASADFIETQYNKQRNTWSRNTVSLEALSSLMYRNGAPRRVLKEDMKFPTNRTVGFITDEYDGSVTFDKSRSVVTWNVNENNHSVEHTRASQLADDFFGALDKVRWTSRTGGTFTGNDEYNRDNREHGGGANYLTAGFGPIGAEHAPHHTKAYILSSGVRVPTTNFPANIKARKEQEKLVLRENRKRAAALQREIAKITAARAAAAAAAGGVTGPQGRVGAGSTHGGEFASKAQSAPEISL